MTRAASLDRARKLLADAVAVLRLRGALDDEIDRQLDPAELRRALDRKRGKRCGRPGIDDRELLSEMARVEAAGMPRERVARIVARGDPRYSPPPSSSRRGTDAPIPSPTSAITRP
jgi:hypothetical protein